jgi:hypothetical protein
MATYPRLNRAALRSTVRELTAIYSTDIISDARINDLINQRLYRITNFADNLFMFWQQGGNQILVPRSDTGKTYRFPGWSWDNTTDFPGSSAVSMGLDLYMESDSDTPPWSQNGQYDSALAYGAAADVLSFINDDSPRRQVFEQKFVELSDSIIRDEFIDHNMMIAESGLYDNTIPGHQGLGLTVWTLGLLRSVISINTPADIGNIVNNEVFDQLNILWSAFRWPAPMTKTYNSFDPYQEIFAYGAAAITGKRLGLPESVIESFNTKYNMMKDALLREKIYVTSGLSAVGTVGNVASQLRALLQDFTNELPEALIYSWINIAYQTLVQEREWEWLVNTSDLTFPANVNGVNLLSVLGTYQRILNVYEVRYDGNFEVIDSEIVYPVPHILDGKVGDSKYKYDIDEGFFSVTPTPTQTTYFRIRYAQETAPFTPALPNASLGFSVNLADIVTYRAAVIGSSWSDYAKKMAPVFQDVADKLFDAMVSTYQLDHSTEPMQLGGTGLEGKKYMPWFRPA